MSQFPIEECSKCKSKLYIENSYFNNEDSNIQYFCNLCIEKEKEKDFVKIIPEQEFKNNNEYSIIIKK